MNYAGKISLFIFFFYFYFQITHSNVGPFNISDDDDDDARSVISQVSFEGTNVMFEDIL